MKTLTEFNGFALKNALNAKKELVAAGKTPEELPAALGEQLKLEGDKLTLFLAALDVAESKSENLKRIVVYSLGEGEAAPKGTVQKDDKHFLAEFFYTPAPKKPQSEQKHHGGKKDGKRRGKGGGGKRFGGKGRPQGEGKGEPGQANAGGAPGEGRKDNRRPPRGPRGPRDQKKPTGEAPKVTPVVQPKAQS